MPFKALLKLWAKGEKVAGRHLYSLPQRVNLRLSNVFYCWEYLLLHQYVVDGLFSASVLQVGKDVGPPPHTHTFLLGFESQIDGTFLLLVLLFVNENPVFVLIAILYCNWELQELVCDGKVG